MNLYRTGAASAGNTRGKADADKYLIPDSAQTIQGIVYYHGVHFAKHKYRMRPFPDGTFHISGSIISPHTTGSVLYLDCVSTVQEHVTAVDDDGALVNHFSGYMRGLYRKERVTLSKAGLRVLHI